jgi:hypothetical protein
MPIEVVRPELTLSPFENELHWQQQTAQIG